MYLSDTSDEPPRDEPARLAALRGSGLLDSEQEEAFDLLTRLACHLLGTPVSLISFVEEDRQFFKSQQGLKEPWAGRRETPLSHSFCQHVVARRAPFVVSDARQHELVRDNPAVDDLDVTAYLGIPIHGPDGHVFGSLCAIDGQPHDWTEVQIADLSELAALVESEIALQHELRARQRMERKLQALNASLEARVEARTSALRAQSEQVRALTQALTLAEHRERRRLAHVLHDDLQQLLFGIQLHVHTLPLAPDGGGEALRFVDDLLDRALTLTRTLSHELALPSLDKDGLEVSLAWLANQFTEVHGLAVTLDASEPCPIADPSLRALLVQITRELLFNVVKHASTAQATVRLRACDAAVEVVVEDEGAGFDPTDGRLDKGFGMQSVRERVALLGGRVAVNAAPGVGTQVTLTVPKTTTAEPLL